MGRASALAETPLDAMERVLVFQDRGLPETAAALKAWIYDSLRHSSFLRTWPGQHKSWYPPSLHDILAEVATEPESQPAKPTI
jgi:hypothetical protein